MEELRITTEPARRRTRLTATVLIISAMALLTFAPAPGIPGVARAAASVCTGDCDGNGRVTVDELVRAVNEALGVDLPDPCPVADANDDGEVTVDELVAAVNNALHGCPQQRLAFVTTTDFQTGSFATITLDTPRQSEPAAPDRRINADAAARVHNGLVYVINRFLADNIQVLDPAADFETMMQCSTGPGSNPHDIAFREDGLAYVSTYDTPELLLVDLGVGPECDGFIYRRIDLQAFADADGIPEMDQMALVGDLLYVAVQRLDRDNFFSPAAPGGLVLIDTATDAPVGEITLTGQNPFAATKGLSVRGGALFVAEVGSFGALDGGIERVDLGSGVAEGFVVTEEELGGDITDFVLVSDKLGYAVISKPDFTNALVAFDPSSGTFLQAVLDPVEYLSDIELNDRGEIFAADRTASRSGVRVIAAQSAVELTPEPISLGLPPFEIVFVP